MTVFVDEAAVDSEVSRSLLWRESFNRMVMVCRIREGKQSGDKVVDVDDLYLWCKYQNQLAWYPARADFFLDALST